jgi:hypothetical protein
MAAAISPKILIWTSSLLPPARATPPVVLIATLALVALRGVLEQLFADA